MSNSKEKVFISYAREDQEIAKKLYHDLKSAGLIPWLDCEDLLPGQNWRVITRQAILECSYFLVLLSANSLTKRGFVQKELKIAMETLDELPTSEIFLIPVRLDDCQPVDEKLQSLQYVDLFPSYEPGLNKILQVLAPDKIEKESKPETPFFKYSTHQSSKSWDEIFVGREDFIKKLLNTKGSFFIFGARRVGKTALLKFVEKKFWENNIPAFYISIQGYLESEKIKRKIRNCFRKRNFIDDESLFRNYSFFDFLEELDLRLKSRIYFLIDEAEQITEIENNEKGFIDNFRNCIETLEDVHFILTASPHFKKVIAMPHCSCSAFLSAFDKIDVLTVLSQKETTELMRKLVPGIKKPEIDQILHFTHYQPYLVKVFVSKLKENGKIRPVSQKLAMETYIANALDGILPNYFAGLSNEYQQLVLQIHRKKFEYKKEHETELRELTQYGYLKHEAGEYQVSNWFFNHWLDEEFGIRSNI